MFFSCAFFFSLHPHVEKAKVLRRSDKFFHQLRRLLSVEAGPNTGLKKLMKNKMNTFYTSRFIPTIQM